MNTQKFAIKLNRNTNFEFYQFNDKSISFIASASSDGHKIIIKGLKNSNCESDDFMVSYKHKKPSTTSMARTYIKNRFLEREENCKKFVFLLFKYLLEKEEDEEVFFKKNLQKILKEL